METVLRMENWIKKNYPLDIPVMIERRIGNPDEKSIDIVCQCLFHAIDYYADTCGATNYTIILPPCDDLLFLGLDVYLYQYKGENIIIMLTRDDIEEKDYLWASAVVKFTGGENRNDENPNG